MKTILTVLFALVITGSAVTVTYTDGVTQVFNPSSTLAGINVGAVAGSPSSLVNGDLWYDSTANALKARINGATVSLGSGTGGDAELDALAGLTSAADRLPYFTGSGTASLATFTAAGRSLLDDADASAQRTTLGLTIGTNVQAYDADLTTYAGITPQSFMQTFLGSANVTTAQDNLNLGGLALLDSIDLAADYTWTGAHDFSGGTMTLPTITTLNATTTNATSLAIGGTTITATGAELNILDGVTATAAELNYVDGVTSAIQTQMDAKAGKGITTKATASSYTIGTTDANELYGGVIYVTGAATLTIPAVASGASFTVITIGAVAVSVDPNASDLIYLDGAALSDGDKVTNSSTAGDIAVFTYYDGTGWYAATNGWTDGN